ncbi:NADH:ubiquinone oxidoreductase subunit 4 [Fusarium oxysporum II5]|nr:NADH:ubiquinone oxidoreductase subunit 4 [Fusarium oxysporum II5]
MLLSSLITIPVLGTIVLYTKTIALTSSIINLIISLVMFILFNNSSNQFQYVQEHYNVQLFDIYLGVDENVKSYLIIMLLLETLLLAVFMTLDIMSFYIFFESLYGSDNKVSASYYLFLYTLTSSIMGTHVESPLGGSIVLAAIVLKLSLYGVFRLILPILPKASLDYTFVVFTIAVITIIYASFSTLRTTDVKELIAYSSGSIILGLAHGFVSSGLFICTRLIYFYRGITQLMPIFAILFFILALGNCGAPLTLNFVGEFMSLYSIIERLPVLGVFACSSVVFSAAYTIYMFNRISFGGSFTRFLEEILFTVILGVYPSLILNVLDYSMNSLIYSI